MSVVAPLYIYFYALFSVTLLQLVLYNLMYAIAKVWPLPDHALKLNGGLLHPLTPPI